MSHQVRVNTGHKGVSLPDGHIYDGQVTVTLTDAQYAQLSSTVFSSGVLTDLGAVVDPNIDADFATDAALSAETARADTTYPKMTGGGGETVSTIAASGAAATLNLTNGNVFDVTLTANCTLSITNAIAGKADSITVILRQNGTGGWGVTWPASVKWPAASAPILSTGAGKVAVITLLTVDGGTTWLGFPSGDDMR